VPLLIGGATTSKVHTAVKILSTITRHGTRADASVAWAWLQPPLGERVGPSERHQGRLRQSEGVVRQRRARRRCCPWKTGGDASRSIGKAMPASAHQGGCARVRRHPLVGAGALHRLDTVFTAWELKGRYPRFWKNATVGVQAKNLLADAQELLNRTCATKLLKAPRDRPASSRPTAWATTVEVYRDESAGGARGHHWSPAAGREAAGRPTCVSALHRSEGRRAVDYIGAFALTVGHGMDELCAKFEKGERRLQRDSHKALADRLAEALGRAFAPGDADVAVGLCHGRKRSDNDRWARASARPPSRPGYPACPDHTEKRTPSYSLLDATATTV